MTKEQRRDIDFAADSLVEASLAADRVEHRRRSALADFSSKLDVLALAISELGKEN